ncbi:MAG TPA: hypothetical protein VM261_06545 [Kofleriaceae bacterium]|nr:hypothetical protein [Kofleriaceae bacterium]
MTAVRRALVVCALLLAATPTASAQERLAPSAIVRWQAPAGCPDEANVRARVDARLAKPLGEGDAIDATVTVVRARRQLRAQVSVWTPAADVERSLVAGRCDELADAVAVVLARAVAEARALAPAPPTNAAAMATNDGRRCDPFSPFDECADPVRPARDPKRGVEEPNADNVPPPRRRRGERARPDGGMRPSLVSGAGISPHVGYGLEVSAWFVWGAGAVEVSGTRWLERLAELPASQRFGAAIGLDALAARACWNPERYGPRVCFLGEMGTMSGRGVGLFDSKVGEATYSAAGIGLSLRARLRSHVALVGGFDMLRAIDRPRFVLDRGTVLFQPDPMAGRVGLGVEIGWR